MSHRRTRAFPLYWALLLLLLALACPPGAALAQNGTGPGQPEAIPDTPRAVQSSEGTPVSVVHRGTDDAGVRLAFQLKETVNRSSLFRLSDPDERSVQVLLITREEFPGRPGAASVYAVTWLYSESEGTLKYHLDADAGVVDGSNVAKAAETLAGRTDEVSTRYSYLFE
jgi:hypothetical protein